MSGIGFTFLRRGGQSHPTAGSGHIMFADAEVLRVLLSKGVGDGVGISKDAAAALTTIGNSWFSNNKVVTTFDEFELFLNVTTIGSSAFESTSFVSMTLPESIKTIQSYAFYNSSKWVVDTINLPSCTSLGMRAFGGVKHKKIIIPNVTSLPSDGYTLGDYNVLEEVVFSEDLPIIPGNILNGYNRLTKVNIPTGLIEVGKQALYNCKKLNIDVIAPNLTLVKEYAFAYTKTVNVNLPNVQEIQSGGFYSCESMLSADLGDKIATIGNGAFRYNAKLTHVIVRNPQVPTLGTFVFDNTSCPIYVPDASVDAYKAAANWSNYASRIKPLSEYQG